MTRRKSEVHRHSRLHHDVDLVCVVVALPSMMRRNVGVLMLTHSDAQRIFIVLFIRSLALVYRSKRPWFGCHMRVANIM